MNWVDLVAILVVAISAMLAVSRGFVREVLGIAAWAGAAYFAVWGFPFVRYLFREWISNPDFADPVAYLALFIVALVFLSVITSMIGRVVHTAGLGGIDRALGALFGIARGVLLVIAAYILAGWLVAEDRWPEPVLNARLLPTVYSGAIWVTEKLPAGYRPHVEPPPAGRETHAADLLHATPQGRAVVRR